MKLSHEFAGIGGDASFYKAQSETVVSRRIASNTVRNSFHLSFCGRSSPPFRKCLSFSTRAGILWSLLHPTYFSDRFQLGGSTNVRMFRNNSMGPRDGGEIRSPFSPVSFRNSLVPVVDSLGGELYWAAGLSLISGFPKKPHWPVKTHLFLNAGRLDDIDRGELIPATVTPPLLFVTLTARRASQTPGCDRATVYYPAINIRRIGDNLSV